MRYSFTLFELTTDGARVRVQTDNTDQPFDINEGSKLELGSTAKLRVLTTYLQIIAELHERLGSLNASALSKVAVDDQDRLSRWAVDYLRQTTDRSLEKMLDAALDRTYSASPGEAFFTGGGVHRFHNFRRQDDGRNPTLRDALRESINLPFIRLMRDLVRYSTYGGASNSAQLLKDDNDPRRQEYLARFADREGTAFLQKFWKKYRKKDTQARLDTFLDSVRPTPIRLAAVHRYLLPDASQDSFNRFVRSHLTTEKITDARLQKLYASYGRGPMTCPTRATSPRFIRWTYGYWAFCSTTPKQPGPRSSRPANSSVRRYTAGCSRVATRAPATVASAPYWRSKRSWIFTSAGRRWVTRSITWCRPWPPQSAAPATARRHWRN